MYGNTFGKGQKSYDASSMPVWMSVDETKIAGCTINIDNVPAGTKIAQGVPLFMDKMGGNGVILDCFEVVEAVTATDTSVKLKSGICGTSAYEGLIVGKLASNGTSVSTAGALGAYANGAFTITANALGVLAAGDKLYVSVATGSNKSLRLPSGLSRRDIYVREGDFGATAACVTKGQILGDRIPVLIDAYKDALSGISFEYEL